MADKKCCQGSDPTCDGPTTCAERAWAENEQLRDEALTACLRDSDEIKRLTAEVERLRAAGDALVDAVERQQWSTVDVAIDAWKEVRSGRFLPVRTR